MLLFHIHHSWHDVIENYQQGNKLFLKKKMISNLKSKPRCDLLTKMWPRCDLQLNIYAFMILPSRKISKSINYNGWKISACLWNHRKCVFWNLNVNSYFNHIVFEFKQRSHIWFDLHLSALITLTSFVWWLKCLPAGWGTSCKLF